MKVLDYLKEENIVCGDIEQGSKETILMQALEDLNFQNARSRKKTVSLLLERESLGSTAVGRGICIPHARVKGIKEIYLGIYLLRKGIDFDSLDNLPVRAFFIFLCPHEEMKLHLRFLARLSRILRDSKLRENILNCREPQNVITAISEYENIHMG
jgi:PTS system nitrogen regulatory IIA component